MKSVTSPDIQYPGVKNSISSELLPGFTDVMHGLTGLITGEENAADTLKNGMSDIIDSVSSAVPKFLDLISNVISSLSASAPEIISSLVSGITDNLPMLITAAQQILSALIDGIIQALPALTDGAVQLILALTNGIVENLPAITEAAVQMIVTLAAGLGEALPELIPAIVQCIVTIVQTLIENMDQILEAALLLIQGLADGIIQALPVLIDALPRIIQSIVEFVINNLPLILDTAVQIMLAMIEGLLQTLPQLVEIIPQILEAITEPLSGLVDFFADLWNVITDSTSKAWNAIKAFFVYLWKSITSSVKSSWNGIWDFLTNLVSSLISAIMDIFSPIVNFLSDLWSNVSSGVKSAWSNIKSSLSSTVSSIFSNITSVFSGLPAKIGSVFTNIFGKIKDFGSNAITSIKSNMQSFASTAVNALSDLPSKFWNIGKNIVILSIKLDTWRLHYNIPTAEFTAILQNGDFAECRGQLESYLNIKRKANVLPSGVLAVKPHSADVLGTYAEILEQKPSSITAENVEFVQNKSKLNRLHSVTFDGNNLAQLKIKSTAKTSKTQSVRWSPLSAMLTFGAKASMDKLNFIGAAHWNSAHKGYSKLDMRRGGQVLVDFSDKITVFAALEQVDLFIGFSADTEHKITNSADLSYNISVNTSTESKFVLSAKANAGVIRYAKASAEDVIHLNDFANLETTGSWSYPVQEGENLSISQVYEIEQNDEHLFFDFGVMVGRTAFEISSHANIDRQLKWEYPTQNGSDIFIPQSVLSRQFTSKLEVD